MITPPNNLYTEGTEQLSSQAEDNSKKTRATPIWVFSILVHSIALAFLAFILIDQTMKKEDTIITTQILPQEEKPLNEEKKIELIKQNTDVKVNTEIVSQPQVTFEEVSVTNETDNNAEQTMAEGTNEGITDQALTGSGLFGNVGGGAGSGGTYGKRGDRGRKKAVMRGDTTRASESSVDWALWWLANHQEEDGHWDSGKYEGAGTPEADSAVTGAALLAFLGAGHTDRNGKWRKNVKNAVKWLIETQRPNGSWDARNYSNGICTMAIAEATGMGCGGSEARKSTELAVDYLLKQQNNSGCFDYTGPTNRDDMSVTGWSIMGLKSAMLSNIKHKEISEAFHKCGSFLDKTAGTSDNTSSSKGNAWYTPDSVQGNGTACQAIAMLVRQYLGWNRTEPWLEAAAEGQITQVPANYANTNVYRTYYAYLTLFQQGGNAWKAWNKPVSELIVAAQRQDGDFRGSWDSNGKGHMEKGGRVLYTAFLCLSLEVSYRYELITK